MKDKKHTAEEYFARIGVGKENTVKRPGNAYTDRMLRAWVSKAQVGGDIIINNGEGYYRPDLNDPTEALEYRRYINSKKARIRALQTTIAAMEKTASGIIAAAEERTDGQG